MPTIAKKRVPTAAWRTGLVDLQPGRRKPCAWSVEDARVVDSLAADDGAVDRPSLAQQRLREGGVSTGVARRSTACAATAVRTLPSPCHGRSLGAFREMPPPPTTLFREHTKVIGGVGKTHRWSFTGPERLAERPVRVLVAGLASADATRALDEAIARDPHRAMTRVEDFGDAGDGTVGTVVVVNPAHRYLTSVGHLTRHVDCELLLEDETEELTFDIGIERFDRSKWNFWNQEDESACPKQSWHKWNFTWLPEHWRVLPFTWSRLAANLDDLALDDAPMPLRDRLVTYRLEHAARAMATHDPQSRTVHDSDPSRAGAASDPLLVQHARARALRAHAPRVHAVTSALTPDQSRELLYATYVTVFLGAGAEPELLATAARVHMHYIRYGYAGRIFGPYKQNAQHVGHGKRCRAFRALPQYDPKNLPVDVLSRLFRPSGALEGKGARQSRARSAPRKAPRCMANDLLYRTKLREEAETEGFLTLRGKTCASTSPDPKTTPATNSREGS